MQMVLLAVILVMAVLNIFLLFIIRQIVLITNRQVQRHFTVQMDQMSEDLDQTLEKLAEARQALKEETSSQKRPARGGAATGCILRLCLRRTGFPDFQHARYRSEESLETYRYIRDHMKLDYDRLIAEARKHCPAADACWLACRSILEKLNFEKLFDLILMPEEEQKAELALVLSPEELDYLEQVAPEQNGRELSERVDEIRQYVKLHTPKLRVESGDPDCPVTESDEMEVVYNPQIHEGIRLYMGPLMLDYSL